LSGLLFTFPACARIKKPSEFDHLFKSAQFRLRSGPIRLIAAPSAVGCARLGLVVGKRHLKRAVDRNQIKRVIREAFRRRRSSLPDVDVVVQLASVATATQVHDAFELLLTELSQRIARS
jgi:ribonuclease P protein component